ncbi:choice-of-anchor M domain-containing protein [Micromonospora pisi]
MTRISGEAWLGRRLRAVAGTAVAMALTLTATPGWASEPTGRHPLIAPAPTAPGTDDALDQRVDAEQSEVSGRAVLDSGHVDIGPRYRDGQWSIQIHDDTVVPSVWRHLPDVVFQVPDAAVQKVPDDPNYTFLGQNPGTPVYVVPQTQNRDVVWIGWNTQDPGTMEAIQRGVTMNLLGVQGPGDVIVYLQSGNLGAPEVLWNSTKPYPQPLWVETNTHTHANWIFSEPGVYLAVIEISADLIDGGKVSSQGTLRFSVGDQTSTEQAFTAAYAGPTPPPGGSPAAAGQDGPASRSGTSSDGTSTALLTALIVLVAVLLVGGLIWSAVRGAAARRRAETEREAAVAGDGAARAGGREGQR